MNKKLITVSMPLDEFERIVSGGSQNEKKDPEHETIRSTIDYLNLLIKDVCTGEVPIDEAKDFYLFQTPMGQVILKNLDLFKVENGKKTI